MPVAPVPSAKGEHGCVPNADSGVHGGLRSARHRVRSVTLSVTRRRFGSCSGHGRHPAARHAARAVAPSDARGGRVRLLVREGARLDRHGRAAGPARDRGPVRRAGAAVRRGGRAVAQAGRDGAGGPDGAPDAVPGGRGRRRGAGRAAGLARMGRGRPRSDRPGCGWPDHRPGATGTCRTGRESPGGRRVATAPRAGVRGTSACPVRSRTGRRARAGGRRSRSRAPGLRGGDGMPPRATPAPDALAGRRGRASSRAGRVSP